ncbi:leucine-rich repeat domain-containing protein [Paenibacillus amylolyticus]|uniref:Copper amine oxidase domain-containing protein n=1 Tax=Paenibacillus amylolyticus TaxID=1451 RepID=A0A100VQG4_PAEAM|nr:leucine-rich repeat domain-containing protein [Paenibacillus amylolyticus]GAS84172.1 copper amine oxidase domain-containing protein [Paenibacillus amylolyticus]
MRRMTLLFLVFILSLGASGQAMAYTTTDLGEGIIEDPLLEDGLKLILNKPLDVPLTSSDLEQLEVVDLSNAGIQSLSGLEYATNLTHLRLYGNEIEDLTPLEHLTQLREIDVRNNYITSIHALAELKDLGRLYISNNSISSIEVVRGFTRLHTFHASGNQIASLAALTDTDALKWLEISNNTISDLTPLMSKKRLQQLNVANNQIQTLDVLAELPNTLRNLNVAGNQITDLTPLEHMTRLRTLDISGNQVQSLKGLEGLTGLTELNAESNQIYDLEPLREHSNLDVLKLSNNRIWDLTPIEGFTFTRDQSATNAIQDISASTSLSSGIQTSVSEVEPAGLTVQNNYLDVASGSHTMQLLNRMNVREQKRTPQGSFQRLIEGSTTAYVGDRAYTLDAAPFIDEGRTYVPLRFVSEQLNASVNWNSGTREAVITQNDKTIRWSVGNKQVVVNDALAINDAPLLMKNGKAFVPVRFISEQFNTSVGYIGSSKTILIFENKQLGESVQP